MYVSSFSIQSTSDHCGLANRCRICCTRLASTLVVLDCDTKINISTTFGDSDFSCRCYQLCGFMYPHVHAEGTVVSCSVPVDHKHHTVTACLPQLVNHLAEEVEVYHILKLHGFSSKNVYFTKPFLFFVTSSSRNIRVCSTIAW